MSRISYSYSVLRYVHDVVSGESLNVGVAIYAQSEGYIRARLQHHYARLSQAFDGFPGDYYRKLTNHIESRINILSERLLKELPFDATPVDAKALCSMVLPDDDSSLQFTEARGGITDDLDATLEHLFDRFVMQGQPHVVHEARTSDEVWKTFKSRLVEQNIFPALHPITIKGGSFEYEFEHAWKNEKWHPLEPLSMDAKEPETIRERSNKWVGRTMDLQADENLGKLYLLLGPPRSESLKLAYAKAKDLLHKMPVKHQLIEEDEAEDFAAEFGNMVRQHGLEG
jgi:hypothetical protein